jgi:hypothetical protein
MGGVTVRWWFHSEVVMSVGGDSNQYLQHRGGGEDMRREGIKEIWLEDSVHQRIAAAAQYIGGGENLTRC